MPGPACQCLVDESRRGGVFVEDLLAVLLIAAFFVVSAALGRPLHMPPLWKPTFLSTLLLLAYGRASWTYLADRRRGLPSREAVGTAWRSGLAAVRAVLPFLVGIMFF